MARYTVTVRTPMSPEDAFDFLADLRNFEEWDPGVERAEQVEGDGHVARHDHGSAGW